MFHFLSKLKLARDALKRNRTERDKGIVVFSDIDNLIFFITKTSIRRTKVKYMCNH